MTLVPSYTIAFKLSVSDLRSSSKLSSGTTQIIPILYSQTQVWSEILVYARQVCPWLVKLATNGRFSLQFSTSALYHTENKAMSDYFPEDIIQRILLKLPVKSLIKFNLVSKSWKSLIKSSAFIHSHLRSTKDSSHLLLLSALNFNRRDNTVHRRLHWLHWDTSEFAQYSMLPNPVIFLENKPSDLPEPLIFLGKKPVADLRVVGTCNGLVCLDGGRDPITLLWNPSIRKVVMLPEPPACFTSTKYTTHGFVYDSVSDDYKLLRFATLRYDHSDLSRFTTVAQVYSLASGCWKTLSASGIPVDWQGGSQRYVVVHGIFHMVQARLSLDYNDDVEEHHKCCGDPFIGTFNLETEAFGEIMIPEGLREDKCYISRYGDSLALMEDYDYDLYNGGCRIWVMKQYGVAESWTLLFNISAALNNTSVDDGGVCGFKRCGEVVLLEKNDRGESRLISLDPKTDQVKVIQTEDYVYYYMDSFVESLVMLDHANAISYEAAK